MSDSRSCGRCIYYNSLTNGCGEESKCQREVDEAKYISYLEGKKQGEADEQLRSIEDAKQQAAEYLNALDNAKKELYQQGAKSFAEWLQENEYRIERNYTNHPIREVLEKYEKERGGGRKMSFIEFAEQVLGLELPNWQRAVLIYAQKCKDDGKSFHINTYSRQGKNLLNNCIQQKLGYDRGFEDGSMLIIRNVLVGLNEIQRGFGTLEEYIDQLEESVNKEEKNDIC